jgi:hypothetical protein
MRARSASCARASVLVVCRRRGPRRRGRPAFPSGPWLRGFHRGTWEAPADRGGWHEADGVTAAGARSGAITIGALESGLAFGVAYLRRDGARVLAELEQRVERSLEPGESIVLEPVRVALGDAPTPLLEAHADAQGRRAGARSASPFQAGWCSWYHFFHDVTEDAFLRNLDALVAARSEIPIELVQLDDGYQRAIGDWLETNEKFPSGLAAIASAVRAAGFTAGLWTAPFCVVPESRIFETHAEWLLRDPEQNGLLRGLHHAKDADAGFVLDTTQPAVVAHLERVFRTLTEMGFPTTRSTSCTPKRSAPALTTRASRAPRACAGGSPPCGPASATRPSCSAAVVRSVPRSGWWTGCASGPTPRRTGTSPASGFPVSRRRFRRRALRKRSRAPGCTAVSGRTIPTA